MIKSFFFSFFVVDMELFWILSIFRVGYYTGSFGHDHGLVVVQVSKWWVWLYIQIVLFIHIWICVIHVLSKKHEYSILYYFKVTECIYVVSLTFLGSLSLRSHFEYLSFSPSSCLSNELWHIVCSHMFCSNTVMQYKAIPAVSCSWYCTKCSRHS